MKPERPPRIIFNDDSCSLRYIPKPHTQEKISTAVDYFKGTQVGALCWSLAAEIAYAYPSKKIENVYDKLRAHGRRGFSCWGEAKGDLMISLYQKGIDYVPLLIGRVHEAGIQFFASIRMNDVHHKSDPRGSLAPEFWQKHQEYRLWEITDARSYYNGCLDYSYASVRKRKLDVIFEVAQMYDIDGIELDMSRSPYFFEPSQAWEKRALLTKFVSEVREGLARLSARKKKALALIIRVPFGEEPLGKAGIDLAQWIQRKLMDILVMTALENNFNQRVEPWLAMCRKKGILFYPSTEHLPLLNHGEYPSMVKVSHNCGGRQTYDEKVKRQRAMASNFLAQGVDGIYMFNYASHLFEYKPLYFTDRAAFDKLASVLSEIGDAKTLAGLNREYCFFTELPIYVETNRPRKYHQTIDFTIFGKDTKKAKKVTVSFRQIAVRNPHAIGDFTQKGILPRDYMDYYINDKRVSPKSMSFKKQPAGMIRSGFNLDKHLLVQIDVPPAKIKNGLNTLAFEIPRFPEAHDPYVYIYELTVRVIFQPGK